MGTQRLSAEGYGANRRSMTAKESADPAVQMLWHYTSAGNLLDMLKGTDLFASSFQLLNDESELAYAHGLLRDLMEEEVALLSDTAQKNIREQATNWLGGVMALPAVAPDSDIDSEGIVGVFSLSEHDNQLSQWRAYGGDSPVAIGFRRDALEEALKRGVQQSSLIKCVYGKDDGRVLLRELARQLVEQIRDNNLMEYDGRSSFFAIAPGIKDSAFSEEAEWRIVTRRTSPGDFHLRRIGARVSAYVPIEVVEPLAHGYHPQIGGAWINVISEVRVGPSRYAMLTQKALEPVLQKHLGIAVVPSGVPFRPL